MRRWRLYIFGILVPLIALLAVIALIFSRRAPEWFAPPAMQDARAMALAERFEQRFAEETSRIRPDAERWAIRLTEEQLNAWLATRLPRWLEHAGVDASGAQAQIHLSPGTFELAMRERSGSPLIVLRCRTLLAAEGLRLTIVRAGVGALPLPLVSADDVRDALKQAIVDPGSDEAALLSMLDALLAGEPVEPIIPIGDGRRIELIDLEVRDGEVLLEARTTSGSR